MQSRKNNTISVSNWMFSKLFIIEYDGDVCKGLFVRIKMIIALVRKYQFQFMLNDWNIHVVPSISTSINHVVKSWMFLLVDRFFYLKVYSQCRLPSTYNIKTQILPQEHCCSILFPEGMTNFPPLSMPILIEGIKSIKSLPVHVICVRVDFHG